MIHSGSGPDKFLQNEHFLDWVNNPGSIYKEYWEQYFQQNPQEKKNADEAIFFLKQLYLAEQVSVRRVKTTEKEQIWNEISAKLSTDTGGVKKATTRKNMIYWVAASVILLLGTGIFLRVYNDNFKLNGILSNYQNIAVTNVSEMIDTNTTAMYKAVYLSDGSTINLAPGSSVKHQRLFTGGKREVYLNGEAFFQVSKNKAKPFYVYTGNIVTRVVGTSFNISYTSPHGNVIVAVRTGKVMVYKKGNEHKQEDIKMLYPMQQCMYKANSDSLDVNIVADKQSLEAKQLKDAGSLSFEDASMETVFNAIEQRFGVALIYNKNDFKSIYITATIENESLENMLKIICKTAGATYKIDSDFIFIEKPKSNS
jgi:ferric-dicitrate binding protein FerR (iron transport regulator)